MISRSQGFKKSEKLCSKKIFDSLISDGNSLYLALLKVIYLKNPESAEFPVQVAFSVPKKGFKLAVSRNLLKRRMREAYRKNKHILLDPAEKAGIKVAFIIVYRQNNIAAYAEIEKEIVSALLKLASAITG
jgi:ribonuclease P protein component